MPLIVPVTFDNQLSVSTFCLGEVFASKSFIPLFMPFRDLRIYVFSCPQICFMFQCHVSIFRAYLFILSQLICIFQFVFAVFL